jgi:hypothetical protein
MLSINQTVLNEIKRYDPLLTIQWNNLDQYFEVWRKMPWGDRLITPIVSNIYNIGTGFRFCPVDRRIVEWLYFADTQRNNLPKKWKWLKNKNYREMIDNRNKKTRKLFENIARDNYNLLNNENINPMTWADDYVRPDAQSKVTKRTMMRTKENARKYFKDDSHRDN